MKKVLFLADFYRNQVNGGAESNDAVLIENLKNNNVIVDCVPTSNVAIEDTKHYDKIILSNFVMLAPAAKEYVTNNCDYIIYEHDHKYITTRDPSLFVGFRAPPDKIVNRDLYAQASKVVVLSNVCKTIIENTLEIDNVHSIGTSLWSEKKFDFIKRLSAGSLKKKDIAVLESPNPTKGTGPSRQYCEKRGMAYDLISSDNEYEFLATLSEYKALVFIPQVLETFCRLIAEAKMLNCSVYTQKRMLGFMSEPFSDQTGADLIETLEAKVQDALTYFYGLVEE